MTTNFPSSIDAFTNPTSADTLDNPPHDQQHADINDAMEAVQTSLLDGAPLHIDDANERMGIGTTTPSYKLDVNGDINTTGNLRVNGKTVTDAPRVLVTDSNGQTLSAPSYNVINFDSETYDTHGMHDTSTNNSRLTAPTGWAGYYWVWAEGVCTANSQFGSIFKNGGATPYIYGMGGTGSDRPSVMGLIPLNATDYVEFYVYSAGGGNIYGGISLGGNSPAFGAIWVAPL